MSRQDLPLAREELVKILKKGIKKFKPSFEPIFGFHYKELEDYYSLEDQIHFLESVNEIGILDSKPADSVMVCNFCKSHNLAIRLTCTLCRSSNLTVGTIIQHDVCGNVDFDYKYMASDGTMICGKCNKRLKAIGVDYSKESDFYKCAECKAVLPNIDKLYMCLKCGESSTENELELIQLPTFTVSTQKLLEQLNKNNNPIISIAEELGKIGIGSSYSDTIVGMSQIRHTFDLVVYNSKNIPILAMDIIETSQNIEMRNAMGLVSALQSDNKSAKTLVLSFIAKSIDTNISNKIILAIPDLKKSLRPLINFNGINLIESQTRDDAVFEVVHTISQICNGALNVSYPEYNK